MRRAAWILGAVAFVLYLALARFFSTQMGDDSFIFFRVVDNLLAGHGPVFNPGEHVEAYSSPLWLLVLAIARALGADYFTFSRVIGMALVAIGVMAATRTARALGASTVGESLVFAACALTGSLHYWAPSGLETSLYVALLSLTALAIARGRYAAWVACTALLGIARPEGAGMIVASVVAMIVARGPKELRRPSVALAALPFVACLVFRLSYFGAPFPNTYYAKATGHLFERLGKGAEYELWLLAGLAPVSGLIAARLWRARSMAANVPRAQAGVALLVWAIAGVVLMGGGDWMWGHRLSLPAYPLLFALVATTVRDGVNRWRPLAAFGALLVVLNDDLPWRERLQEGMWFGFDGWKFMSESPKAALKYRFVRPLETIGAALTLDHLDPTERVEGTMTDASRVGASWLVDHTKPDALIAVNHAGALPFYTKRPTLDMTGLADHHIAHDVQGGLHEKYDPAYVLSRKPAFIVLNSRVQPGTDGVWYHEGYWSGETALVKHPDFATQYRARPEYWRWDYSDHRGNFILVYERVAQP